MKKLLVTKSFVPPIEEFKIHLEKIWSSGQFSNKGACLKELESSIQQFCKIENFLCFANGTLALQLALSSLDINDGEIITTPFSYVATISSILWQRCQPVFVDIEPDNFTIDSSKIEAAITERTKAILAVHVFSYACDIEAIDSIAKKYNIKVIYDAAHAFGSNYKGKSLLSYGDISITSFHATKLFHTCEGGGAFVKDEEIAQKLDLQSRFGHNHDEHYFLGINCKMSELHAAMGLTILPHVPRLIHQRKIISSLYDEKLASIVQLPKKQKNLEYNYSYYPVLFENQEVLLSVFAMLNSENIFPRRYFYPSLNTLPYIARASCPVSENISSRIACLPLKPDLSKEAVDQICYIINKFLSKS